MKKLTTTAAALSLMAGMAQADGLIELPLLPELTEYSGEVERNPNGVPIFRLCTGSQGFTYNIMARALSAFPDPSVVDVQVINIGGSWSQLAAMSSGQCDGAIIQPDAGVVATRMGADISDQLLYGASLHPEFVTAACSRDNDANNFNDMQSDSDRVVIVGSEGSGTAVTVRGFQEEDRGYRNPTYRFAPTLMQAARIVSGGQADCLIMTSGLGGPAWAEMDDRYGESQIRLVPANDGDFNDTRDLNGERLYEFFDIPAETGELNDLLSWRGNGRTGDIQTVMMRAVFVSRLDYPELDAGDAVAIAAETMSVAFDLENYGLRDQ